MKIYQGRIREALTDAIDTRKLAETWAALHPKDVAKTLGGQSAGKSGNRFNSGVTVGERGANSVPPVAVKAVPPALSQFLAAAAAAITRALKRVLGNLWPEGWVLGQQAARAVVADLPAVDWANWEPGDPEAAMQVAGDGLRQLLDAQDVTIKSIADSRLQELGDVLAEYISSPEAIRPPLPEPLPPQFSVQTLADALTGVLDNPGNAELVAVTKVARAQTAAAMDTYLRMGLAQVDISTADDARVCPRCNAAEAGSPYPLTAAPRLPLHPRCRCAMIPAAQSVAALAGAL